VSDELGVIAASVLVFVGAASGMALIVAALSLLVRRAIRRLPPANQAAVLLAVIAAPALTGLALVALAMAPSVSHLLGFGIDHCHGHGQHGHVCPTHAPLWTDSGLDWLILTLVGLALTLLSGDLLQRLGRVRRVVRGLEALRLPCRESPSCRVVEADAPLALTAGVVRPRVYLSARLLDALSPVELAAVVGHEKAHRRRRDALRLLVADLLSRLYLPPVRRRLLAELNLATERTCDEAAASAGAGRLGVASALLKVAHLNASRPCASTPLAGEVLVPSLGGAHVGIRIEALLGPAPAHRGQWPSGLVATATAALLLTLGWLHADRLHHGIESLLYLLIA
jgi:Zn-dependent protease with chaperone function